MAGLREDKYVLLQAATGAGKTILFSELIKRWLTEYPSLRIAIVAHRRELITQARDKLVAVWPEAWNRIGTACASVTDDCNLGAPVVVGSVQTLIRRMKTEVFHLLIVDEAHHIPPKEDGGQYNALITAMESVYPGLRVLGVTATPYRLGHGYIYGGQCKAGYTNLFQKLHCRVSMAELQSLGYLCKVRAKVPSEPDLSGIKVSGDYNIGQLSEFMSRTTHIESAVKSYMAYGEDRRYVLVFCVTIEHAKLVQSAFGRAGFTVGCVHSEMRSSERDGVLSGFAGGNIRILANVGVLTEGWDCPKVDLVMMLRPTKSAALFVQMIGRGTRPAEGKNNLLVLDLANNYKEHGDPNKPRIRLAKEDKENVHDAPSKVCPECKEMVHAKVKQCPVCEHVFEQAEPEKETGKETPRMSDLYLEPTRVNVTGAKVAEHVSKAGNRLLKIILMYKNGGNIPGLVPHYMSFDGNAGYFGRRLWKRLAGTEPPASVDEALERSNEIAIPQSVFVKQDGKFLRVEGW